MPILSNREKIDWKKKSRNKLTFITSELEKERRRREKVRQKNIVEEIILENSPNLAKDISLG